MDQKIQDLEAQISNLQLINKNQQTKLEELQQIVLVQQEELDAGQDGWLDLNSLRNPASKYVIQMIAYDMDPLDDDEYNKNFDASYAECLHKFKHLQSRADYASECQKLVDSKREKRDAGKEERRVMKEAAELDPKVIKVAVENYLNSNAPVASGSGMSRNKQNKAKSYERHKAPPAFIPCSKNRPHSRPIWCHYHKIYHR